MHKNKSYLPKYKIVGFDNYYINDKYEVINKRTNRFIKLNRDKGTAWHYYTLVNNHCKICKVGLGSIIKTPYFASSDSKVLVSQIEENISLETTLKEIGFL